MTEVTASVLSLAGFALAEAVRRVCDAGAGIALTAFTMADRAGERVLTEHGSGTTAEIAQRARLDGDRMSATGDEWAFAPDVVMPDDGEAAGDRAAIIVDFQAPGMIAPASIVQRYERATSNMRARLRGLPSIGSYDDALDPDQQDLVLQRVESGVRDHPSSERLWRYWEA
ncbi:MAG: hypothetical protein M3Y05_17390 [Gemmatimonadota bacterium]|nr:hypothetical protein [Gemmatimonadota bacterium]